jgi:hypothetical protein
MKKFHFKEEFFQCEETLIPYISQFYDRKEYEFYVQISENSFGIPKRIILMHSPTLTKLLEKNQKRIILDSDKIDINSWELIYNYLFGKKIITQDNFQLANLFISSMYFKLERFSREILKKMELNKQFFENNDFWYKSKLEKIQHFPEPEVKSILQIESLLNETPKVKLETDVMVKDEFPLKRKRSSSDDEIEKLKLRISEDSKRIKELEETNAEYESKIFSFHKIQNENQTLHQNNQQLHQISHKLQEILKEKELFLFESEKKYTTMEKYFMEKETTLQVQLKNEKIENEKILFIYEKIFKIVSETNPTLKNLF